MAPHPVRTTTTRADSNSNAVHHAAVEIGEHVFPRRLLNLLTRAPVQALPMSPIIYPTMANNIPNGRENLSMDPMPCSPCTTERWQTSTGSWLATGLSTYVI